MADTTPRTKTWSGVLEFELARLLRRARDRGRLGLEEVIEVLRDEELTLELIADVRRRVVAQNIEFDETVDIEAVATPGTGPMSGNRSQYQARVGVGTRTSEATDSTYLYLREIGQVALLTSLEEVDLANGIRKGNEAEARIADLAASGELGHIDVVELSSLKRLQRHGDRSRDRLTRANLRLVVSVAKKYRARGLPLLDLVQEGNLGLMRAVGKFDADKGFKFSTYATWWIRQAITRAIADQARTIRIPVHKVDAMNRVLRVQRDLAQELEREPSYAEIGEWAILSPVEVESLLRLSREQDHPLSLDSPLGEEQDASLADLVADPRAVVPADAVARRLLGEEVLLVLDELDDREQDVVRMRFGLDGVEPQTLEQVGSHFGVTRERVRQIEARTMSKLKQPNRSERLRDYLEGD